MAISPALSKAFLDIMGKSTVLADETDLHNYS